MQAEALRKKERFKEAHKYQRMADKLEKAEKQKWFKKYLVRWDWMHEPPPCG